MHNPEPWRSMCVDMEWHSATQFLGVRHKLVYCGLGETACWIKWLVHKREDQSSDSRIHIKVRQVRGGYSVILVHGRQRRGIFKGGLVRLAKSGSSGFSQRTCLSKEGVERSSKTPSINFGLPKACAHTGVYTLTNLQTCVCPCTHTQTQERMAYCLCSHILNFSWVKYYLSIHTTSYVRP